MIRSRIDGTTHTAPELREMLPLVEEDSPAACQNAIGAGFGQSPDLGIVEREGCIGAAPCSLRLPDAARAVERDRAEMGKELVELVIHISPQISVIDPAERPAGLDGASCREPVGGPGALLRRVLPDPRPEPLELDARPHQLPDRVRLRREGPQRS